MGWHAVAVLDPVVFKTEYVCVGCDGLVQLGRDGRERNPHAAPERDQKRTKM